MLNPGDATDRDLIDSMAYCAAEADFPLSNDDTVIVSLAAVMLANPGVTQSPYADAPFRYVCRRLVEVGAKTDGSAKIRLREPIFAEVAKRIAEKFEETS